MQTHDYTVAEPRHDSTVTVEADTVEQALAEVTSLLGRDAQIIDAEKVHSGGIGGFFAREMIRLTARRGFDAEVAGGVSDGGTTNSSPGTRGPGAIDPSVRDTSARDTSTGIAGVLRRLSNAADAREIDFQDYLAREMAGKASADSLFSAVGWSEEASGNPAPSPITAQQDIAIDLGGDPIIDLSTPTVPHEPQPQPVGPPPVHESIASHQTRAPDQNAAPPSAPQLAAPQLAETHLAESHLAETQLAETNLAESHLAETQPPELLPPAQWRLFDISDAAPSGMGVVAWSTTALARLGLPPAVVEAVVGLDPRDDLGWINGLAGALAPLCGPVPKQPTVVVGANADQLAEALAMPVLKPPELPPYSGSFGAVVAAQASDLAWLEHVRGDRPIHVVIGDAPWRDLLLADPVAVSWAGETAVVDAVYLASTLRCVLGFGSVDGFLSSMVKVTPIDVALAIRRLVGRR